VVTEDGVVEITGTAGHDEPDHGFGVSTDPQYTFHVRGLEGNDTLRGGVNADTLDGGAGWDTADYSASTGGVRIDLNVQDGHTAQSGGQAGSHAEGDVLTGIELVIGTQFDDVFIGNAEANIFFDRGGHDYIDGGAGPDMVDYSASTNWVNVDLNVQDGVRAQSGGGEGNHADGDTLKGIERVTGTNDTTHGDVLIGSDASNWMSGLDGNDTIDGGAGYDTIRGGDGDDLIYGGNREDSLYGDAGNDTVYGGNGIDTIFGGDGDDYLVGFNSDGTSDGAQDLLIGGWGNDTLDGSHVVGGTYTTLVGGSGADRIMGNGGNTSASYELTGHGDFNVSWQGVYVDLRLQGPDADGNLMVQTGKPGGDDATGDILTGIVNLVGSNGADTLIGNDQNNYLYGVDGNDLLIGGAGNDQLWGVNENDTLEGGLGSDLIWGGLDYDIASYANAATGVNISLDIQYGGLLVRRGRGKRRRALVHGRPVRVRAQRHPDRQFS